WESTMGRLVAVNPRGVGQSSSEKPADFRYGQHLDDLEAVRRRLGVERWVFWGGSAGGCIGLLYALHYPRAVHGLVLAWMGPSARRIAADRQSVHSPYHPQNEPDLAKLGSALEHHPTILGAAGALGPSAEWVHLRDDRELGWVLTQDGAPLFV